MGKPGGEEEIGKMCELGDVFDAVHELHGFKVLSNVRGIGGLFGLGGKNFRIRAVQSDHSGSLLMYE